MIRAIKRKGGKKHHGDHERFCQMTTKQRKEEYMRLAEEGWNSAWDIYHSDGWKLSAGKDLDGGCVYTKHYIDGGKIFKLDGIVDASPRAVFDQLVHGDNESPAWNPTVLKCQTLEKLDNQTDIAYNISSPGAGGLVTSRDFVNLRHWKSKENLTLSLGLSTCHPEMPPSNKYVRAENKPAAWVFKPVEEGSKCHFTLILKTDLKGWLPHYVVDQAMTGCLENYIKYLRDRMNDLKQAGALTHLNAPLILDTSALCNGAAVEEDSRRRGSCDSTASSSSSFQSCDSEDDGGEYLKRLEELDLGEEVAVLSS